MLRTLLAALALAVLLAAPARAEDFQDGIAAYERGDYAAAAEAWRRAADAGNADAFYNLGVLYETGEGVEQDYATAVEWYQRALEAGVADAGFNLGNLYREGRGVEQDLRRAFEHYEIAAQDDHPGALNNLGGMMLHGLGVEPDPEVAAQLFYLAAQRGSLQAMVSLGAMFEEGVGLERDLLRAASLYHTAAAAGSPHALEELRALRPAFEREFPSDATGAELIRQLQALLNAAGLDAGPVDGAMGPRTRGAIEQFEQATDQPVTGEPSREVRDQLVELLFNPL